MTQRWEYLTVIFRYEGEEVGPEMHTWTQTYLIYGPDGEEEKRHIWSSEEGTSEAKITLTELLNELGEEGWELASETVLNSVVLSKRQGFSQVGVPISTRWIFKRQY